MAKKRINRKAEKKTGKNVPSDMPNLRSKAAVEAVVIGDLHLSLTAPVARAEKWEEWKAVMRDHFVRVNEIVKKYKAKYIICTGDIFHIWNSPAELVNLAIHWFKDILSVHTYSVAGNHDLPNHDYEQINRSAYWTLVEAGAIHNLPPRKLKGVTGSVIMTLHGFPCGSPLEKCGKTKSAGDVAVIHDYCHKMGHDFPGAPEDKRCQSHREKLGDRYDAALFGDNHKGFLDVDDQLVDYMPVLNVGGFIQRNIDEVHYKPQVGLLHADGGVSTVPLGMKAQWEVQDDTNPGLGAWDNNSELNEVIDLIQDIKSGGLDYKEAIRNYCRSRKVSNHVKTILISVME